MHKWDASLPGCCAAQSLELGHSGRFICRKDSFGCYCDYYTQQRALFACGGVVDLAGFEVYREVQGRVEIQDGLQGRGAGSDGGKVVNVGQNCQTHAPGDGYAKGAAEPTVTPDAADCSKVEGLIDEGHGFSRVIQGEE